MGTEIFGLSKKVILTGYDGTDCFINFEKENVKQDRVWFNQNPFFFRTIREHIIGVTRQLASFLSNFTISFLFHNNPINTIYVSLKSGKIDRD